MRLGAFMALAGCVGVPFAALAQAPLSAARQHLRTDFTAFVHTLAPPGQPEAGAGEDVWTALDSLNLRREAIVAKYLPKDGDAERIDPNNPALEAIRARGRPWPDVEEIYAPTHTEDAADAAYYSQCRDLGLKYLADCTGAGLFVELDRALKRPWAYPQHCTDGTFLGADLPPSLGGSRQFSRLNRARMHLAIERADMAEFAAAFDQNLRLAAMWTRYPGILAYQVSLGIAQNTLEETQHAVKTGRLDDATCARLLGGMEAAPKWTKPSASLRAEQFTVIDACEAFYEDTAGLRPPTPDDTLFTRFVLAWIGALRIGTLRHADLLYSNIASMADMTPVERRRVDFDPIKYADQLDPWEIVLSTAIPNAARVSAYVDQFACHEAATRTMLALERYRFHRGAYPGALADLAPEFIAAVLIDGFSGAPLVYKAAPDGMGYTLYSVGRDGVDNAGRTLPRDPFVVLTRDSGAGFDFVFRDDTAAK